MALRVYDNKPGFNKRMLTEVKMAHSDSEEIAMAKFQDLCKQLPITAGYQPCQDLQLYRFYKGAAKQIYDFRAAKRTKKH